MSTTYGHLLQLEMNTHLASMYFIHRRLNAVEVFFADIFHAEEVAGKLKSCGDLERIMQKVTAMYTYHRAVSDLLKAATMQFR